MKKTLLAVAFVLAIPLAAQATPVTFFGSNGSNLSATATFDSSVANQLTITLTNTSLFDVLIPTQVLTALFFDIDGVTLAPVSASLASGSVVFFGSDGGGDVGGEWAYASGLTGAPHGATQGISSTGLGLFGDANFGGTNLQDPLALDGLNYGVTSAGDDPSTGNTPVTGGTTNKPVALINKSFVFSIS